MSDIKLEGSEELEKLFQKLAKADKLEGALTKATTYLEGETRKKAKKGRTGELARSIDSRVENDKGIVFTALEYAPYVEYGTGLFAEKGGRQDVPWNYKDEQGNWHTTSGMKPQPFMRPALDENREEIIRILKEALFNND